jgi:hypothetical protein
MNTTLRKLEVLLGTFDFAPLKEVLEIAGGRLPRATEGVDA